MDNIDTKKGLTMSEEKTNYKIEWNETMQERYELSFDRLQVILEEQVVPKEYQDFFRKESAYLLLIKDTMSLVNENRIQSMSEAELKELNDRLYEDLLPAKYATCYGNPEYTAACFGEEGGQIISILYTELRGLVGYAFEKRFYEILIHVELF